MSLLEKQELNRFREFVDSEYFPLFEKFVQQLKVKIGESNVLYDTEWMSVRAMLQKEHQMTFIDELIRLIEEEVSDVR